MFVLMKDYTKRTRISPSPPERRWLRVLNTLNEYQARLFVAEKALEAGRGGASRLSKLTGMSRVTINSGVAELRSGKKLRKAGAGQVRAPGGGRKKVEDTDPALQRRLKAIVEETTAGDPMSPVKWTSKSTRTIAEELKRSGHSVSNVTVARCLEEMGYTLQANVKTREGPQHPDRDGQFRYLNRQVKAFRRTGDPVISVDTKKKELVGAFKNGGRRWMPKGKPDEVSVYGFPSHAEGKAIPYGAYDIARNRAVVNVGVTHETAEFAVESIRRWWRMDGRRYYREAPRLLICADSGGGNSNRARAWKLHLQKLSDETGLAITVCHYPPGTSKWNKIEHRMCCHITKNWRGKPLLSRAVVVNLIGNTKTKAGLHIRAELDTNAYETGIEVSDEELAAVRMKKDTFHGEWNYTISPTA